MQRSNTRLARFPDFPYSPNAPTFPAVRPRTVPDGVLVDVAPAHPRRCGQAEAERALACMRRAHKR
eukprot:263587-Chlamydomonas_euryale.AAC.1